jgi:hypothetical protein
MAELHDDGYMTDNEYTTDEEEDAFIEKLFRPETVFAADTNVFKNYSLFRLTELIQYVNYQAMRVCRKEIETNNEVWKQWEEFITELIPGDLHIPPPQPKAKTIIPEEIKEELISIAEWENHIRTYDIDFV